MYSGRQKYFDLLPVEIMGFGPTESYTRAVQFYRENFTIVFMITMDRKDRAEAPSILPLQTSGEWTLRADRYCKVTTRSVVCVKVPCVAATLTVL